MEPATKPYVRLQSTDQKKGSSFSLQMICKKGKVDFIKETDQRH